MLVVQGFAGSDPGHGHSTAHQAMLWGHPTQHRQRDIQLEYTTMYWGLQGEEEEKKKGRLATDVSSGANLLGKKKDKESEKTRYFNIHNKKGVRIKNL